MSDSSEKVIRIDTRNLDREIDRGRAQLLILAQKAKQLGHDESAERLIRAYQFLGGDQSIDPSELKGPFSPRNLAR